MSKEDVSRFFDQVSRPKDGEPAALIEPTPGDVIAHAASLGYRFTESELRSHMKELIYTARSLPKVWGWPLARELGLARK